MMAAKSDGVLKLKRSDVAFTPLQNSEHCGSAQGLLGQQTDSVCTLDVDFPNGESQCCGRGGSKSPCFRLSREQQKYVIWDCLWIVAAVSVYLADVGTDVWLSVDYYLRQDYWWFGLTLFFVVLGSFSVQLFSFRWFVADFSTEDNVESAVGCPQLDGSKLLLSGSASQQQPDTPQRQMNTVTNGTGGTGGTATARGATQRSPYYSVCVWLCQSIIHILQLGQIWRTSLVADESPVVSLTSPPDPSMDSSKIQAQQMIIDRHWLSYSETEDCLMQ